jgi:predicted kinase
MKGKVTILCGLPGSGKTWYTKDLEDREGVVIFNLDRELFKKFGKDFTSEKYQEYEKETKQDLLVQAQGHLKERKSVIFDYGFWKEKEREKYRKFALENDADFELVHFSVPTETIRERLSKRKINEAENNHMISSGMLDNFIEQFELPKDYENATQYN